MSRAGTNRRVWNRTLQRRARAALSLVACVAFTAQALAQEDVKILTSHIGYETDAAKRAVILGHPGDEVTAFKVLNADSGAEVVTGTAVKVGAVDQWKDWQFWTADLSGVNTEGNYVLTCTTNHGDVRSFPFAVQHDVLERNTLSNIIYYFKGQRCEGQLAKADSHLKFEDSSDPSARLDLHGGWVDATGDSGKHLSHLSFSVYFEPQHAPLTTWALLKSSDVLKQRGSKNFRLYRPRMIDEALYGADFLYRCKNPSSSFFRSVDEAGPNPEDRFVARDGSGGLIAKTKNPNKLQEGDLSFISKTFAYEVGFRLGGGMAIAALAKASTYPVSGEYSSAQYLQAAREGYAFLKKYNLYYTTDGKENVVDDYCVLMAATELYKATHDEAFKTDADMRAQSLLNRQIVSKENGTYWRADDGERPFYHAADAGLPVVALLNYREIADEGVQKAVLSTVRKAMEGEMRRTADVTNPFGYARQFVQNKAGERRTTFFYPHDGDTAPWWQGENARLASLASAARMTAGYFKSDTDFHAKLEAYAFDQLNWIVGMNPYDCCMLHGSGRNNLFYTVNGSYAYTPAPGGIVNGITSGITNPHDIAFATEPEIRKMDDGWRWEEQWLPHSTWFLYAVSQGE